MRKNIIEDIKLDDQDDEDDEEFKDDEEYTPSKGTEEQEEDGTQ